MIVDLVPSVVALLGKIKQSDDRSRKFRVVQQVEVSMKSHGIVRHVLPGKDKLEVQIYPPAGNQRELKIARQRRSTLQHAMREHGKCHHDRHNVQDQQRVAGLRHGHLNAANHFVVDPASVVAGPHHCTYSQ